MFKKIAVVSVMALCVSSVAWARNKQMTAYYFHGTMRCPTCYKIESYTESAMSENFKNNKNISFKSVNIDEPENQHFITDYNLYTKSVVLVDKKGNAKNLDKIWTLTGDEYAFKNYIVTEVNEFIGVKK